MMYDLQKASVLKRISAWVLDVMLLMVIVVGAASLIAQLLGFEDYSQQLEEYYSYYEEQYSVSFDITEEEYAAMTQEEQETFDAAWEALINDDDAMYVYNVSLSMTFLMVSLSILVGMIITEFVIPLLLKNGQTVGKKIFSLGVTRTSGVKINTLSLFVRAFLGKFTVETMIPVLIVMMLLFEITGIVGTMVLLLLLIVQLAMMLITKTNSAIHDMMSDTAVVDMTTQMIFNSEEDLLEYKKKIAAENAAKQSYY